MNLNKAFVLGNLTRDPEKRNLPSGNAVVSFGVATNRFFTNQQGEKQQEAEFHNITAFGKLADIAVQYLRKGSMVLIEGRLRTRSWQDSAGVKHFRTEIIADNLQLGPRGQQGQTEYKGKNIKNKANNEDIPVIEEESEQNSGSSQKKENDSDNEEEEEQEIDISKIPF